MTRVRFLVLAASAALAVVPAAAASAKHGRPAKIQLVKTKLGMILVSRNGYTVYAFGKDSKNHDACQKIKNCIQAWPPVTSMGAPVAGSGVKPALLGTLTLKDGKQQVTYAGHPLYNYIGDTHPAETSFVNIKQFGARWPALDSSGNEVK